MSLRQHPGIEVKKRRLAAGLSLRGLGTLADVDKQAIKRIEDEETKAADPEVIDRLATALGCTPHDLEYPDVPAPSSYRCGAPLDAVTEPDGQIVGRTLEAWLAPALRREVDAGDVVLPVSGATDRWFAARLGPVAPDMVSRDRDSPWRLAEGDIVIFRPAEPGEQPHDALVVVSMDDPDSEGLPVRREVRIAQQIAGKRIALHPVAATVEPEIMRRDWEIIAVGVDVRRPL